ncbi:HNH endonuclease [Pseudomonas sp. App30]|uniref:HNH endonuclease n=1 Tax=Pseudomonas sp. App30 TaxID=3068990 RepID=UPI003A80A496
MKITLQRLKESVRYSPIVGVFEWRRVGRRVRPGFLAGGTISTGYVVITIDRKRYLAHQLAWLYMTGEWPDRAIDHIDGDRSNNAFSNLRLATASENQWNKEMLASNTSKVKGVYWYKELKKWRAFVGFRGKDHYVGVFDRLEDAEEAVKSKRKELHGEFANHGMHKYEIEENESEKELLTQMCG